jgi:hypothetical protein
MQAPASGGLEPRLPGDKDYSRQEIENMGKSPATNADMKSTTFDYEWKEISCPFF